MRSHHLRELHEESGGRPSAPARALARRQTQIPEQHSQLELAKPVDESSRGFRRGSSLCSFGGVHPSIC